jgi:hypothetical protein
MQRMSAPGSARPEASGETTAMQDASPAPNAGVAGAPDEGALDQGDGATSGSTVNDTTFALTLLGIVLAGVGLMVLLLSWLARRRQDPLLR